MSTESAFRRRAAIEEAPLQNELMLFDPETAKFYLLNPTMAFLWRHCDGSRQLRDIAAELAGAFDGVTPDAAANDLQTAAGEMVSLGLLLE